MTCLPLGSITITLPSTTPAGYLVVRGRHTVEVDHTQGAGDTGFLTWARAQSVCDASNGINAELGRSYFQVNAAMPSTELDGMGKVIPGTEYLMTVFTQVPFPIPAGGGPFTLTLNGKMLRTSGGGSTNAFSRADNVIVEFRP